MKELLKRMIPPQLITHDLGSAGRGCTLLTFDDGPNGDVTRDVLDRLDAFDARALFFLIGERVEKDPTLAREIARRGHEIGNHSHTHFIGRVPSYPGYRKDLQRCQAAIADATGVVPRFYRPPGGHLGAAAVAAPRSLGLRIVRWDSGGGDWNCERAEDVGPTADRILSEIGDASIVLLHDLTRQNVSILERILAALRARRRDLRHGLEVLSGSV